MSKAPGGGMSERDCELKIALSWRMVDTGDTEGRGSLGVGSDLPHTVQRMNSILASFSLDRSRLIAMAACATRMAPM